jgi:hypothetical protein
MQPNACFASGSERKPYDHLSSEQLALLTADTSATSHTMNPFKGSKDRISNRDFMFGKQSSGDIGIMGGQKQVKGKMSPSEKEDSRRTGYDPGFHEPVGGMGTSVLLRQPA